MTSRTYTDVLYEVADSIATVTINRPERYNAFTGHTVDELSHAFKTAWADRSVGVVILTGAGDRAFCSGGDMKERASSGDYGQTEFGIFEAETLHRVIRTIPKPVIAAVNGYAIGGGHVLHVLCDLSIAASSATFGQTGPKVGSFDAGFGTNYLARIVGQKRAREIWYLCRQYDAQQAYEWGLLNAVVEPDQLMNEARSWAREILRLSPTALRFIKHSFNTDTEHQAAIGTITFDALDLFSRTPEAQEAIQAFVEKRPPDFTQYR